MVYCTLQYYFFKKFYYTRMYSLTNVFLNCPNRYQLCCRIFISRIYYSFNNPFDRRPTMCKARKLVSSRRFFGNKMVECILGSSQRFDLAFPLSLDNRCTYTKHTHTYTQMYVFLVATGVQPVRALSWVVFRRSCFLDCLSFFPISLFLFL